MTRKVFTLFFLTSILTLSTSDAAWITGLEVKSIDHLSEEIQKKCPPETCVVIGVGRSPAPIIAYLQENRHGYAQSIPLSNFRYGLDKLFSDGQSPLDSQQEKILYRHFDHFLPKDEELKGRSVMFLDFSLKGASVLATTDYFKKYLKERHREINFKFTVLTDEEHSEKVKSTVDFADLIVLPSKDPLMKGLLSEKYDSQGEYGTFNLKFDHPDKPNYGRTQPSYLELKNEISHIKPFLQEKNEDLFDQAFSGNNLDLKRAAAASLDLYHGPHFQAYFQELIHDSDIEIKKSGASLLYLYHGDDVGFLYRKMLADKDLEVQKRALSSAFIHQGLDPDSWIDVALSSQYPELKRQLFLGLHQYKGHRLFDILQKGLHDSDSLVVRDAISALRLYHAPDAHLLYQIPLIKKKGCGAYDEDPYCIDTLNRQEVVRILSKYHHPDASLLYIKLLKHKNEAVRRSALEALKDLYDHEEDSDFSKDLMKSLLTRFTDTYMGRKISEIVRDRKNSDNEMLSFIDSVFEKAKLEKEKRECK